MSSEASSSALLDLKAELSRKKEVLNETKLHAKPTSANSKANSWLKSKVNAKNEQSEKVPLSGSFEVDEDEERHLKSRSMLEAKARLYEKIISEKVTVENYDDDDICLVNFRKKVQQNKSQSNGDQNPVNCNSSVNLPSKQSNKAPEFVGGENPPVHVHLSPEKMEGAPLHYQNVQFNEVRDHGVGYFAFSGNEEERQKQMQMFRDMRHQAERKQKNYSETQKKKEEALKSRLSKVCERRCIDKRKFIKESVDDKSVCETAEIIDVDKIPLPKEEEKISLPASAKKIRPWDIGKEERLSFTFPEKKKSAEKWIEEKRSQRSDEFAPPQFY